MIIEAGGKKPNLSSGVFIAPNASVIGDVTIGENSGIWFQAVVRGDINSIVIGKKTNIQDMSIVHVPDNMSVSVGDNVTVGHRALIHGCKIGNNCLIGMGSIIMDDAEIGDNCMIGAGSLVTQGTKIPPGSLAFGSPAKVVRQLTAEEIQTIEKSAQNYFEYSRLYMK